MSVPTSLSDRLKAWKGDKSAVPFVKLATPAVIKTSTSVPRRPTAQPAPAPSSSSSIRRTGTASPDSAPKRRPHMTPDSAVPAVDDDVDGDGDGRHDVGYLQTVLKQLFLLKYRLLTQASHERQAAERDLLLAWKAVHDAEEEAAALHTRAAVAQEIIRTHTQLASLRHQLEAVHAALPVAAGTLGGIAAAGAALSRRYPLVHVSKHMIARPDGNDHNRGGSGSDNTNGGSLSPERGHQSYLGPSQLSAEQAAEVDERVALRLTRLTAAFATVGDALRYRPETLTRLVAALAALEALPPPLTAHERAVCAQLQRLETKVTAECAELVSDRISYAIEQEAYAAKAQAMHDAAVEAAAAAAAATAMEAKAGTLAGGVN